MSSAFWRYRIVCGVTEWMPTSINMGTRRPKAGRRGWNTKYATLILSWWSVPRRTWPLGSNGTEIHGLSASPVMQLAPERATAAVHRCTNLLHGHSILQQCFATLREAKHRRGSFLAQTAVCAMAEQGLQRRTQPHPSWGGSAYRNFLFHYSLNPIVDGIKKSSGCNSNRSTELELKNRTAHLIDHRFQKEDAR
jgi:hypothetical protein